MHRAVVTLDGGSSSAPLLPPGTLKKETSMASIYKEITIDAPLDHVWAAIRDFGAVQHLVPGLVVDCRLDGDSRVVTFADGRVARELLVDIDDKSRRLVYAEPGTRFITRSASVQVFAEGENRSRVIWINDILPNEFAELIGANMDRGVSAMKQTLERSVGDKSVSGAAA
jgi:carbon monoxide dehydrogenase subunit G